MPDGMAVSSCQPQIGFDSTTCGVIGAEMAADHSLSEARRRDLKATIDINAPLNSVPIAKYYGFAERLAAQCVHHLRMDDARRADASSTSATFT